MAWSWSHSGEAYSNAEANVYGMQHADLVIVYAEWRAAQGKHGAVDSNAFSERKYQRALRYAETLPDDALAEFVWERAQEASTCDNGGWNAWVCPSGCHTVPFDLEDGVHSRSCVVNGDHSGCDTCRAECEQ